jgi:hypothetical protein
MMRATVVLALLLLACEDEPAKSPATDEPASCTRDEECQMPACGPCTAGAPITPDMLTQTCVVNPCPQAVAHCTEKKHCAVKCVACAKAE